MLFSYRQSSNVLWQRPLHGQSPSESVVEGQEETTQYSVSMPGRHERDDLPSFDTALACHVAPSDPRWPGPCR